MEAVHSCKYWQSYTKVQCVMTKITTSLISTSNLSMNSTLHNKQKYTPATQSKVQKHWHQWKSVLAHYILFLCSLHLSATCSSFPHTRPKPTYSPPWFNQPNIIRRARANSLAFWNIFYFTCNRPTFASKWPITNSDKVVLLLKCKRIMLPLTPVSDTCHLCSLRIRKLE
jgi:hypothetical protein